MTHRSASISTASAKGFSSLQRGVANQFEPEEIGVFRIKDAFGVTR
jgi:hypothetical protein